MVLQALNKFFHRFKRYIFKYKDGFYEVPYLANSPELILESFKNVPFMKWDDSKKLLSMKNHFLTGNIYWIKLEDGLWFILADTRYNVNLHYKFIYDKYLPADYYLISFNRFSHESNNNLAVINGLSYKTFSWNVIKPGAGASNSNFKNTNCTSIGLYFSEDWAKKNLLSDDVFLKSKFHSFILAKKCPIIVWPDKDSEAVMFFDRANLILENPQENEKNTALKSLSADFINYFTAKYDIEHTKESVIDIKSETHLKLVKIEQLLNDHLFKDFPGIEFLSDKFGLSPTKLKNDFKQIYGESIYQYYLGKQMDYAKVLITEKNMRIGEVSNLLGYKNDSKFSEAFKNKHGVLPSKISTNNSFSLN
jgi:AraC-like DNA-binding protein